jgi:orotate phosphoribosyltransferase
VVVCEDVVTRGTSPMEAAEVVRELGAEPVMVMPVVDRGGTCGALAEAAGLDFRPLVTALELGFPYEGP